MRQQSAAAKERAKGFRDASVIASRRTGGRCEVCGARRPSGSPTHHVFHRKRVAAWLADDPANLAPLCYPCHDGKVHGAKPDAAVIDRLENAAVERLTGRPVPEGMMPMDVVRAVERAHS